MDTAAGSAAEGKALLHGLHIEPDRTRDRKKMIPAVTCHDIL
ncbi:hypothetical protein [Limimaricola sp.]|nr:hypothetical protein [Limimaricola sp.]